MTTTTQAAGTSVVLHAAAAQPFDFDHSLAFLERFPAMTGEQATSDGALRCAIRAAGLVVGVRIRAEGDGLRYELECDEPVRPEAAAMVADRLSFFLGLDDDVASFYALAHDDPPFQRVIRRLYGYHQVKFPSPLELLVWAILGQRVPMPVARRMKHAIVDHVGNRVRFDGQEHRAFPDLEQLLEIGAEDLVALIRNRRKAGYVHGAVRGWAELSEAFLRTGDEDLVREQLLALPGIGPWSATFLMIRGLGRTGQLPPDREGRRAASAVYGREISDAEFVALADGYGPWKGLWGHYLRVAG